MAKKHHKFSHSHLEHHKDGSITLHHVHEEGPHKDVKHASADHDGAMDSLMDHTSAPNSGEGMNEANAPMAAPAGAPAVAPGAPGAAPAAV